ncbi:unnamed protein product, partial [Ectocarpus sp. 13 AM-2016]
MVCKSLSTVVGENPPSLIQQHDFSRLLRQVRDISPWASMAKHRNDMNTRHTKTKGHINTMHRNVINPSLFIKPATYRRGAAHEPTAVASPSPRATPYTIAICRALHLFTPP